MTVTSALLRRRQSGRSPQDTALCGATVTFRTPVRSTPVRTITPRAPAPATTVWRISRAETTHAPSLLDVAVLADELLLLAVLAVAGLGLGGTGVAPIVLAVVLPLAAAAVWAVWLAPRAARRLGEPAGLVTKVALYTIAAGLLAAAEHALWAVLFWLVSVVLLLVAARVGREA